MFAPYPVAVQQYNNYSEKLLSCLPTIDPNEKVRFALIPKGNPMIESVTTAGDTENRAVIPNAMNLHREEDIIDPGTGNFIKIAWFDGLQTPTSTPKVVWFKKESACEIEVIPARQPDLYRRLMFSEFNRSNPNPAHRIPTSGYLFDVIRPEKTDRQRREDRLKLMKAQEHIELAVVEQLLRLAPKAFVAVPSHTDPDGSALRNNFTDAAVNNPELIINLFTADEEELFTLVDKAVKHEVVQFDRTAVSWKLAHNQATLCIVLPGMKVEDSLVQFLILPENEPILKAVRRAVTSKEK